MLVLNFVTKVHAAAVLKLSSKMSAAPADEQPFNHLNHAASNLPYATSTVLAHELAVILQLSTNVTKTTKHVRSVPIWSRNHVSAVNGLSKTNLVRRKRPAVAYLAIKSSNAVITSVEILVTVRASVMMLHSHVFNHVEGRRPSVIIRVWTLVTLLIRAKKRTLAKQRHSSLANVRTKRKLSHV